jgi:hypothetical protein
MSDDRRAVTRLGGRCSVVARALRRTEPVQALLAALDRSPGRAFHLDDRQLDCRIGGLLAELPLDEQGRWSNLEPVTQLADRYVDRLAAESARRDLQPIVMGPPSSNLQVGIMKTLARDAYLSIIERFNAALKAASRRQGLPFADLVAATRGREGLGRATLYIDNNYLLPTAVAGALTEMPPAS